jgi:RNA polymerase sigma-70 factor (ECF subfamily)
MDARRAFEDAYAAHERAVRGFVLRRLGADGADDVVSEVFLAAWRRFDEMPRDPLPWLLNIARGAISNRRRAAERGQALVERLSREHRSDGSGHVELDLGVFEALAALADADRELLMLVAWEELSGAQLAVALGVPRGTVAVRVHRARRRFERALTSQGSNPGQPAGRRSSMEVS